MNFKDILIEWNPATEGIDDLSIAPVPAIKGIPNWYTSMSNKGDDTKTSPCMVDNQFSFNTTMRRCQPFYDAMTFGYVQLAWQDIFIQQDDQGKIEFAFPIDPPICKIRSTQNSKYPIGSSFNPVEFVWLPKYYPKVPKGYSCFITHPINRYDLPFVTLSGVTDSDDYIISDSDSNLPFYVRKGFTGIIPVGTPLWQVIPFKRESWMSKVNVFDSALFSRETNRIKRHLLNAYRKEHWKKKSFR